MDHFQAIYSARAAEYHQMIAAEDADGQLLPAIERVAAVRGKRILVTGHRADFYRTISTKLLTYATGRGTEYYDVETIDRIVKRLDDHDGKFSALLLGVVDSAPFQKMRTQATVTAAN